MFSINAGLEETYQSEVRPPPIEDPVQCRKLSLTALKIHLSVHAKYDGALLESATRAELVSRLEHFLLVRRADNLLREFVFGVGAGMDVDDDSGDSF